MKRKLSALLLAAIMVFALMPSAVFAAEPVTMTAVGPTSIIVNSGDFMFPLEVKVNGVKEVPRISWYEVNWKGDIISVNDDGSYKDVGYGGRVLVIYGVSDVNEWHHYKAVVNTSTGAAECYFKFKCDPNCKTPTYTSDGIYHKENGPVTLNAVSPQVITVKEENISFDLEVEVKGTSETPYVHWYKCTMDGELILNSDGDAEDVGFGGTSLYIHNVPDTYVWHCYMAKVMTENGGGEVMFMFMRDPACINPTYSNEDDNTGADEDPEADRVIDMGIQEPPLKLSYKPGEAIDMTGFRVRLLMNMGYKDVTDASQFNIYPKNAPEEPGSHTISVEYQGHFSDVFEITVEDTDSDKVIDMDLTTLPKKLVYNSGEYIDLAGFKVRLLTENGFLDTSDGTLFEAVPAQAGPNAGTQIISLQYSEGVYDTFEITVKLDPSKKTIPFTDVNTDDYFYSAVNWAYNTKPQVTDGTSPTTFSPYKTVTRGQVVTFLWRAFGQPKAANRKNPFVDVTQTDYFYEAVLWAVEEGITDGTSPTTFSPARTCTNAHILTFIWRNIGCPGKTDDPVWYADAIRWAENGTILDGTYAGGGIKPNADCPRANVVVYLYRLIESMKQ